MKRSILYILVIMLLSILGNSQIPTDVDTSRSSFTIDSITTKTTIDSIKMTKIEILENRLGKKLIATLQKIEKVQVYHVETLKTDDLEMPNIEGFSILTQGTLDSLEEQQFRQLVMDTSTYYLEQSAKQCLFMPRMAIQLTTENDTINALLSLKCDLIRFYYGDTTITLNSDDGRIAILDYFSKAFPDAVFARPTIQPNIEPENFAAKSPKPIHHIVESGDNWNRIKRIARKQINENITLDDLYTWNNIPKNKRNKLKIGEEVIIGYL